MNDDRTEDETWMGETSTLTESENIALSSLARRSSRSLLDFFVGGWPGTVTKYAGPSKLSDLGRTRLPEFGFGFGSGGRGSVGNPGVCVGARWLREDELRLGGPWET